MVRGEMQLSEPGIGQIASHLPRGFDLTLMEASEAGGMEIGKFLLSFSVA
jgi:hypothetical protein